MRRAGRACAAAFECRAAQRVRIATGIHSGCLSFDAVVTFFSAAAYFLPGSCSAALAAATRDSR
jgi:hypothetical protein